jgi:adenine-specific DNA methylase
VLIEEWLPAAAIGVECMRERGSASALAPHTYLHVWWARRPLVASRAAVLASLLPADFPRDTFERLLGFWASSDQIVEAQRLLDWARQAGTRVQNPHGPRAFKSPLRDKDLEEAHRRATGLWGHDITVIDPMAGGGSIPLEAARLGFKAYANEYNPVACSVLEATVDYPFRFGEEVARKARKWGAELRTRFNDRVGKFFPKVGFVPPLTYLFARTVPCPDTQFPTPLVPDWHLLKPKGSSKRIVAEPVVDRKRGTWDVRIRPVGQGAGQLREAPTPTYADGKGISLFTGRQIPIDYIKAKARAGEMGSTLYAVVLKTPQGFEFRPPEKTDLKALEDAERELDCARKKWERTSVVPTENIRPGDQPGTRLDIAGIRTWAGLFSPRQLLCFGVLVEELRKLRSEIVSAEGRDIADAVELLLALVIDKFANHNCILARFENTRLVIKGIFGRHGYEFHPTHAEMAPCNSGSGLDWAIDNVLEAYEEISRLPHYRAVTPVRICLGSASGLPQFADCSVTAVVVDPPYADNVQYSELADFFYVWLKRTQGHRRPEWFSTYLCEHDQEAVVNISRHRANAGEKHTKGQKGKKANSTAEPRAAAHEFYQNLMTGCFREMHRILRDDGVLTVMFTHKKQRAWEALFTSLVKARFTISATWPVKTESEHSLHQAKKNAAQSTVLLVARKREKNAGIGYFDSAMRRGIAKRARAAAERLQGEGLNPVDQLVGSFGPAMEVYSQYDEVRTDTGHEVLVDRAIDEASEAVIAWRIEHHAPRGLEGVEPEGRFAFLCWDVLGAAEFRYNEAHLLGKVAGMDVDSLVAAGLVTKSGDKVQILSARDRRRDRALEPDEVVETLFGPETIKKKATKRQALKVHPNDPSFRTVLDSCHALALRFIEAKGGAAGVGSAKALVRQQQWRPDSAVARLMAALVQAAPEAVRHDKGKRSAAANFPEFRAWHALLQPLFGLEPPDWTEKVPLARLPFEVRDHGEEPEDDEESSDDEEGQDEEG